MHHPLHQPLYNTTLALLAALTLLAAGTHTAHAAEHFCGQTSAHPIDKTLAAAAERSGGVTVDLCANRRSANSRRRVGQGAQPRLRPGPQGRWPRTA